MKRDLKNAITEDEDPIDQKYLKRNTKEFRLTITCIYTVNTPKLLPWGHNEVQLGCCQVTHGTCNCGFDRGCWSEQ